MSRPIELPTADSPAVLVHGEALEGLRKLPAATFDAVITDPPYSSGGFTRGDRQMDVRLKYQQTGTEREYPAFSGDSRDQRAYAYWCALWLGECRRVTKPGALALVFTDWRQLPSTTDALQAGDWVYRGIIPWHKPGARPCQGRPTAECEYLVWGTNGPRPLDGSPFPGFYSIRVDQDDKYHLTGKPTRLMEELVKVAPPGGLILDPFAGSATTLVAAVGQQRLALGIEREPAYVEIGRRRINDALGVGGLFAAKPARVADLFAEDPT